MKKLEIFNYAINNRSNESVDVYIDGVIVDANTQQFLRDYWGDETSVSYKSFRDHITQSDAKTINVFVNSYGGHIGDAMAIHDMLIDEQAKGKTVNTKGRGIIASAATFILMAGNSEMSANSWFMIHNASGGIEGDVNVIETYARVLRKFNDRVRDFYASATGMRKEDVTKMMDAETWMTAVEAKEKGFVKNVTSSENFKNAIPAEKWHFENKAVLNQYNSFIPAQLNENQKKLFIMKDFKNVLLTADVPSVYEENNFFGLTEDQLEKVEAKLLANETAIADAITAKAEIEQQLAAANAAVNEANENFATATAEIEKLQNEIAALKNADGAAGADVPKAHDVQPDALPKTSVDTWWENMKK